MQEMVSTQWFSGRHIGGCDEGEPSNLRSPSNQIQAVYFKTKFGFAIFYGNKVILSRWWFQPNWKILVKMGIFPNFRGENKKKLKPPLSYVNNPCSKYNKGCVFIKISNIGNDKVSHRMDKHPPVFPSPPNRSEAPVNPNKNQFVSSHFPHGFPNQSPISPHVFCGFQLLGGSSQELFPKATSYPSKNEPIHHISPGITLQVKNSWEFKVPS